MPESKARVAQWHPACSVCHKAQEGRGLGAFHCCFKERVAIVIKHTRVDTYYHWNKPEVAVLTFSLAGLTHSSLPTVNTGK